MHLYYTWLCVIPLVISGVLPVNKDGVLHSPITNILFSNDHVLYAQLRATW